MFVNAATGRRVVAALLAVGFLAGASSARAAQTTLNTRVTMSDGASLAATITGEAPLQARPTIVEFSPYGAGSGTTYDGTAYNYLLVQIRGTGDSDGQFDALGPRTQQDVVETLGWACKQSWSDGRLGLNGFSASAITVYNSLHLALPCVRTAALRSGTFELYRDLLWPGGVSNFIPGLGVLALIGAPTTAEGSERLMRAPLSSFDTAIGLFDAGLEAGVAHPTLDDFWRQRGFQGDANHLPILMLDSFFDVESRGAFQAYQALRGNGAHLLVVGGHDGAPQGTDDGDGATKAWFDHYLLGADNGIQSQPRVQMLISDGSREGYLAGDFIRRNASDWPVPGTSWSSLWLSGARSASGNSTNDGSLVDSPPSASSSQSYAAIPTIPTASDVPNSAIVGPDGLNQAAAAFPLLTETALGEPQGLTYTTAPLAQDVLSVGPAALDLRLSSTASETAIWAVISDLWPDGSSHPLATGRLLSAYPNVIRSQSLIDQQGDVVQPYGDYSAKSDATPGTARDYQIEFWPIGNRFKAGHRIRLVILGASAASAPSLPALNTVGLGGADASRLLLPVLPASGGGSGTSGGSGAGSSCPTASGRLRGSRLGPLALGMTRAGARRKLPDYSTHGRRNWDFFCLTPVGIRAAYASAKLVRKLPARQRRHAKGRIVLLLTADRRYALRGVRPGARVSKVARRLHLGRPLHIGRNWWYFTGSGRIRGMLKVRHGKVIEVGIAQGHLVGGSRRTELRFMTSF